MIHSSKGETARKRILSAGRTLFLEIGLHAVTTNEIARRARVSKKTLYAVFPTKDDLIEAIVFDFLTEHLMRWDEILERSASAIDGTLASLDYMTQFLPQIQSQIIDQIGAVSPALWEKIDALRTERLRTLTRLVKEGQREGMVRTDIDPEHWILLLTGTVRATLTPAVVLERGVPLVELVEAVKTVYFDGILTEKGRAYVAKRRGEFQ